MLISQNKDIEVFGYESEGYEPTMNYESWRVAFANYAERFDKEKFERLERHLLTDEVFVLISGGAELVIGKEMKRIPLENGKIYNVKKGAWHNILIEKDAKVLIVENHNTGLDNTEYYYFKEEK